jgi:hypothetical protein
MIDEVIDRAVKFVAETKARFNISPRRRKR